jgi:hypothetical protein
MTQDYSELVERLEHEPNKVMRDISQDERAALFSEAATAIRALVDDNWRLREALGVLTACASSDDAFGLDNALSNARAALGETE